MMAELRKRRRTLEDRVEKTVSGSDESWLKSFLVQQFLVSQANEELAYEHTSNGTRRTKGLSYAEVQEFWEAGLIEKVESLDGALLMFADGWDLGTTRAAMRVRRSLGSR